MSHFFSMKGNPLKKTCNRIIREFNRFSRFLIFLVFVIFSPSKNISDAQGLREIAAYLKDEMPIIILTLQKLYR